MIKIVFCRLRRREFSPEEFRRYWMEDHAELVRRHGSALRIRRYTQSHTILDPRIGAAVGARGSEIEPYDGVAEVWWDSVADIIAAGASKAGRDAGRALLQDERNFVDLIESPIFYAEEHVVIAG